MAKPPVCQRCGNHTLGESLTSITLCVDDESALLQLCHVCLSRCKADVTGWLMFGQPALHVGRAPRLVPAPSRTIGVLPPAVPSTAGRRNVRIPFPVRHRTEVHADDPVLVAPEILHGQNHAAVIRATGRWTWASGCRDRVKGRDLDPVDVLLAADCDTPDWVIDSEETPDVKAKVYRGIKVIIAPGTNTIIDAYQN